MSIKKAILTCEKLTVYSPIYCVKIIKSGQKGTVIDVGDIKVFCISHEGTTYSSKVEIGSFKYIDEEGKNNKNIDIIKNYTFDDDDKKENLYTLLLTTFFKSNIGVYSDKTYAKAIHAICTYDDYKSDTLPIPCGEYSFFDLIEEWYNNENPDNNEELLTRILQTILFECEDNNIDINKLFN